MFGSGGMVVDSGMITDAIWFAVALNFIISGSVNKRQLVGFYPRPDNSVRFVLF